MRDTRAAISNIISLLTLSSFALTAFLLEKKLLPAPARLSLLADVFVIAFVWAFFLRYKTDLRYARQGLKARQDLIVHLNEDDTSELNPFPHASSIVPDIRDQELWWLPCLSAIAILAKAVAMSALLPL